MLVYRLIFKLWYALISLFAFRVFIFSSLLVVFPYVGTAYAGRIQRNKSDGIESASSFCHAVVGLSWSYTQMEKGLKAKPDVTNFAKAANEIGLQLSEVYGRDAPKKYTKFFVDGWNLGMKRCYQSL